MNLTGKNGRVTVSQSVLTAFSWKVTLAATEEDVTVCYDAGTFNPLGAVSKRGGVSGYGYQQFVTSLVKCTFDVEAYWDTALNPFSAAIGLFPGQAVGVQLFYDRDTPEASWRIDAGVLTRVEMSTSVRGPTLYSFSGTVGPAVSGTWSPYNPNYTGY